MAFVLLRATVLVIGIQFEKPTQQTKKTKGKRGKNEKRRGEDVSSKKYESINWKWITMITMRMATVELQRRLVKRPLTICKVVVMLVGRLLSQPMPFTAAFQVRRSGGCRRRGEATERQVRCAFESLPRCACSNLIRFVRVAFPASFPLFFHHFPPEMYAQHIPVRM